jgi:acetyltransferase
MLDVGWGDLIDHLGSDPGTKAILLYIESIEDARAFLSAAREVALTKPIIAVKAGRTAAASIAAASHTGAMTGSDAVLDAAFHRCGVMRVNRISDLFYMADLLGKQPRPRGPRLMIMTNAGGPAVLAADSLILNGGELAPLSDSARSRLDAILPKHWSRSNPVDILGDATADRFEKVLEILSQEPETDGLLFIMAPQAVESPSAVAERLKGFHKIHGKPVLSSFMGGSSAEQAAQIIEQSGLPNFPYPDTAARAFANMWRYASHLKSLYETPIASKLPDADSRKASIVIDSVRKSGRTLLTESESKQVLEAHAIPVARTIVAHNPDEAARAANAIGYPAVLKLHSTAVTHKTDVSGVKLGIRTEAGLRLAYEELARIRGFEGVSVEPMISSANSYEVIFGASYDPQFGPVILFGSGGELVEVYQDRALGLPPLNSTLALRLIEDTRIFRALKGIRGRPPCDLTALTDALVRFSSLILIHPEISEIDVNPLLVGPSGSIALDARIVLFEPGIKPPQPAIRPYPAQYTWEEGGALIRPIRPEDEPLMIRFHQTLSDQTVYFRYFAMIRLSQRISHERLSRICFVDYDREIALVALKDGEIVAVGRISSIRGTEEVEFAVVVNDRFQKQGWGTRILTHLIGIARAEGRSAVVGDVLLENRSMQHVCRKVGFVLHTDLEDGVVHAVYKLRPDVV